MAVPGETALIRDLAIVLVTAAATSVLFQRIRAPVVLGYLAAGLLVGPHLLPVAPVQDAGNIAVLAQLGVLFLLFSLGLDFHLTKLKRVGALALTSGALEMGLMIGVGVLVANLFGWGSLDALFLGAVLAISSTTIILKVLDELGLKRTQAAQAIFGILLVEDLFAVMLIALLSSIALTGTLTTTTLTALAIRVALFVVVTLVAGLVVVPRMLDRIARKNAEETLLIAAIGVAFAMALLAETLGLSLALGAFIAGAVVAESRASPVVERRVAPLRDVFTAVFFVSTGVLINPADILTYLVPILILTAVSILGKVAAVSLGTFVAGYPSDQAMRVGLGMAMVGEFSFVIAGLGRDLGVTSSFLFPIVVSVSALTTLITPFLIRRSDDIVHGLGRRAPISVRSYARMYTAWVWRRRGQAAFAGMLDGRHVARVLAYVTLLTALVVGGSFLDDAAVQTFGDTFAIPGDVIVLTWTLLALAALPVAYGLVQSVRRLVQELVYVIIPPSEAAAGGRGAAAAAVLRRTIYVFLSIVAAAVAFAALITFLPPLPLIAAAAVLVGATAYALSGAIKRLNEQIRRAVDAVFVRDAPPATRDQLLSLIRERTPWEVSIESVLIPAGSRAAHRRIRDIGLPQRTGATIVTHERDGAHTVNPAPDLRLLPGDAVGILGDNEQVAQAKQLLVSEEADRERIRSDTDKDVNIEEVEIDATSPLAGTTLAGSRIRERTGASIVGLRREGVPILNPAPVTRLRPGDALVILGSRAQVDAARAFILGR